ncbi:MAG: ChaN family lipoprotein [Pseudomonadota bacterium]
MKTALVALLLSAAAHAAELPPGADIYILGELHDNPAHHVQQAEWVSTLSPAAVAFEMLTPSQAALITPYTARDADTLGPLLAWEDSGWPSIEMYAPVMSASDAVIVGVAGDPPDLTAYDLDIPLSEEEQATRQALQQDVHCGMLPDDILPGFVARQREKDAQFAELTLRAYDQYGGPVVLITGNGHARTDWGVPAAIARVRPDLRVVSAIQGEGGATPPGDLTVQATAPERDDPCAVFR